MMTRLSHAIHGFDDAANRFGRRHPYLILSVGTVAMPLLILAAVAAAASAVVIPLLWLFGAA